MKKIIVIKTFIESVLFSSALFLVSSCSQKKEQHLSAGKTNDKIIPPRVTLLAEATIDVFDLKDKENKPTGLKVELILPFETAF